MMESLRTDGLIGMAQIEAVGKAGVGKIIQTRQPDCGFQAFAKSILSCSVCIIENYE